MTRDQIMHSAVMRHGALDFGEHSEPSTRRAIASLLADGFIERRERTVDLPAQGIPAGHDFLGISAARTVTIVTYHATALAFVREAA